jgi:membrane-bound lytic murein transglycosylase D
MRLPFLLASLLSLTACAQLGSGPGQTPAKPEASGPAAEAVLPEIGTAPAQDRSEPVNALSELVLDSVMAQSSPVLEPPPPALIDLVEPDVWDRMREGFAIEYPDDPRIDRQRQWYASNPDYLARTVERARPFLSFILDEIEARELPTELALLPIVESAFQTFAYSPGRAAGIWQIIPSTGRLLGLRQTWWYDGRRDVYASTQAALEYLQSLGERFDGDWTLALASYNAGPGRVSKAVRHNERRGRPSDFWSLDLARETEAYVPKLLALKELVTDPDAFGITLPRIEDEIPFTIVDVGSQIDLALAAELAGLPMEEFYHLNPGFNRWASDPEGPHRLLVPKEKADPFLTALEDLPAQERIRWVRHQIRSGETLSHLADRYGTTVALIQRSNELRGHTIRAGGYLLVPTATGQPHQYTQSASQRLIKTQNRERPGVRSYYSVRTGDSLWSISRRYGVSVNQLARWNNMAPGDLLRPGDRLAIWTRGGTVEVAQLEPAGVGAAPPGTRQTIRYRVRSGDSLWKIARKFNVEVSDIRSWNRVGKYLQPGQTLKLHIDVTRQSGEI